IFCASSPLAFPTIFLPAKAFLSADLSRGRVILIRGQAAHLGCGIRSERFLIFIETNTIKLWAMQFEKIFQFVQPLRSEDLVWAHSHAGVLRIIRIRIARALHVSQRTSDSIHTALAFSLNKVGITADPFLPLRVNLLLGRIVVVPFLLKLLAILVSEF